MPQATDIDPLQLLDRRWSPQVLVRLLDGPQRFAHLASDIPGVSRRMLSERLRELESAGLVVRTVQGGPPISVTYALAEEAGQLKVALQALKAWAAAKAS